MLANLDHYLEMLLRRPLRLPHLLGVIATLVLGALVVTVVVEANTYYARDRLKEAVYGSKPHRVPCEEWPTPREARRVIDQYAETVSRIEYVNPGFVQVEVNTAKRCPGRADIRILYASRRDRDAIKSIIGDARYFFGVPYNTN